MAVIQSGDTTDQLHVDTHQAAYVTLRDASGAAVTPLTSGGSVVVTSAPAVTGSLAVTNFPATQPVSLASAPLPSNAATESGHLASIDTKLTGPLPVSGTFFQATQPVSIAGTVTTAGTTTVSNFPATQAVTGAFFQATQPVSAAALPLPTNAAIETGGNLAGLNAKVTTTANGVKVDGSAVTQPVSGTFWPATQPVSIATPVAVTQSGTWSDTVTQATAANLNATVTQGPAGATAWKVDGSAVTQPVSAAALPLPAGAATDTNLTARTPLAANGALLTTLLDGAVPTYAAGTAALALAAAATDIFTIYGSATKTIKITRVCVSFIATTAISAPVSLIKRAAVNTGGTSVAQAATPLDSSNAAATATCLAYTANPTALGTAVGTVLAAGKVAAPVTGATEPLTVLDFGLGSRQAITLRGTTQGLAINLNGATVLGGNAAVSIEWTET